MKLEGPLKKYLTGKLPSHSSTVKLHENFDSLTHDSVKSILTAQGFLNSSGKPTQKAVDNGLIDVCEKYVLWNLDNVHYFFTKGGMNVSRKYVNQTPPSFASEPTWVNLGTIGSYFNASSSQIGKWIDELGLRDENKMASKESQELGLANVVEMNAGGKKTRKINQWNATLLIDKLMNAGHPLDFDYEASLQGKGKNGDVQVDSIESRVKTFLENFKKEYTQGNRSRCDELVKECNPGVLRVAELKINKPGFFTEKKYRIRK